MAFFGFSYKNFRFVMEIKIILKYPFLPNVIKIDFFVVAFRSIRLINVSSVKNYNLYLHPMWFERSVIKFSLLVVRSFESHDVEPVLLSTCLLSFSPVDL